jgi:microcystin-dependent protein
VITQELNSLFSYNKTESERFNFTNLFFDLNKEYATSSSSNSAGQGSGSVSILSGLFGASGGGGSSSSSSNSLFDKLAQTSQDTFTEVEVNRLLDEHSVDTEWNGNKLVTKSFEVFKLTDVTDSIQVAVINKQLIADKKNGAIIRTINVVDRLVANQTNNVRQLTGTVQMIIGGSMPDLPWLVCNGSVVSRKQFPKLFALIGDKFGKGDGLSTFNLPDFRNRVAMGANSLNNFGIFGGSNTHALTIDQLPAHDHDVGSLITENDGAHAHSIQDPGHDHGGRAELNHAVGNWGDLENPWFATWGQSNMQVAGSRGATIRRDTTKIEVLQSGLHSHGIKGRTGATGQASPFSIVQPYFTVNYIIYAD